MASIKNIKPGQTLYDVKINTGLASFRSKYSVWTVLVKEVHLDKGYIVASWNGNENRNMYERTIKTLKVKEPKK